MSLSWPQMQSLLSEIKPLLKHCRYSHCEWIDQREFIVIFSCGESEYRLLFCFQAPFLRFHLTRFKGDLAPPPFLQKITEYLSKSTLQDISLLNEDRILCLSFQHRHKKIQLIAEFFPKSPNCYLLDSDNQILESLNPSYHSIYQLPFKPICKQSFLPTETSSQEIEKFYLKLKQESQFQEKKQNFQTRLQKLLKRTQRLRDNCLQNIKKCQECEHIQHEAILLQAHLFLLKKGLQQITIADWQQDYSPVVIALNPQLEPQEEIAKRFQKSKKLKLGLAHDLVFLKKKEEEMAAYQSQLEALSEIQSSQALQEFQKTLRLPATNESMQFKSEKRKALPMREFQTISGDIIWVGKNAQGNDKLTFSLAKGSDIWMHVVGVPGSHVILRTRKGVEADPDTLQDALQLALCYSQAKATAEADVHITQCKYVTRLGREKTGKVQISKHKIVHVKLDSKRLARLKEQVEIYS